jgi:hypothetical protein
VSESTARDRADTNLCYRIAIEKQLQGGTDTTYRRLKPLKANFES